MHDDGLLGAAYVGQEHHGHGGETAGRDSTVRPVDPVVVPDFAFPFLAVPAPLHVEHGETHVGLIGGQRTHHQVGDLDVAVGLSFALVQRPVLKHH